MKCPKCGKEMDMFVSVRMRMPSGFANHLSKQVIAKKEVKVTAVDWERASVVCTSCNYREIGI